VIGKKGASFNGPLGGTLMGARKPTGTKAHQLKGWCECDNEFQGVTRGEIRAGKTTKRVNTNQTERSVGPKGEKKSRWWVNPRR